MRAGDLVSEQGGMTAARVVLARLRDLGGDVGYDHEGAIQAFIPDRADSEDLREALRANWPGLKAEAEREWLERVEEVRRVFEAAKATGRARGASQRQDWPNEFVFAVPAEATRKVDAIRDRALACGWTLDALYQNHGAQRFPASGGYGLACFVAGDREIGEVCSRWIEVIGPAPERHALRFYNPAVDQPWIQRGAPASTERMVVPNRARRRKSRNTA